MLGFRRVMVALVLAVLLTAPEGADVRDVRLGVKGAT
jgi:hypothetical protein